MALALKHCFDIKEAVRATNTIQYNTIRHQRRVRSFDSPSLSSSVGLHPGGLNHVVSSSLPHLRLARATHSFLIGDYVLRPLGIGGPLCLAHHTEEVGIKKINKKEGHGLGGLCRYIIPPKKKKNKLRSLCTC